MNRLFSLCSAAVVFLAAGVSFSACSLLGLGGASISDISASSGTLTGSGSTWSFDAGRVPQYTSETVTFTVTNSGGSNFTATGSSTFDNTDFSTDLAGTFVVNAHSSNTFTGTFRPTFVSGEEDGMLTLTPTSGTPIVINLKGTTDTSFTVYKSDGETQVTDSSTVYSINACSGTETWYIDNADDTADITLTGSPYVSLSGGSDLAISSQPPQNIDADTNQSFVFEISGGTSSAATVSISGINSINNSPFTFQFQVSQGGCG